MPANTTAAHTTPPRGPRTVFGLAQPCVTWDGRSVNLARSVPALVLASLALCDAGCAESTRQPPAAARQAPYTATPGQASAGPAAPGGPATALEAFGGAREPRQLGSADLFLPGNARQQRVNFATVNGQAVLEGDILLGPATTLPLRYGIPWQSTLESKSAVAVASRSYLWPDAEIPYAIDASAQEKAAAIDWAFGVFSATPIRFRPRTASDRDYVVFRELGSGCWSYLGRQGGAQDIDVTTCAGGNIAHELMHAAGFYHEQSRGDRDDYIAIVWDEITAEMRSNFDKRDARGQDIGPYDYGSIMHYPSTAGSRSGKPTIIPRDPNARIGQREGLSALDRAAIDVLYPLGSRAPSAALPPAPAPTPAAVPTATLPWTPPAPAAPAPTPPAAVPAPTPTAPPAASTSFTGTYSSARGGVSCSQGGLFVQCQYPGGSLFCAANGPELACTWSGGGQGRATFQRQASGVLAGSYGDGFSADSRGRWDLTPASAPATASIPSPAPAPAPAASPRPMPAPATPSASPPGAATLSGNYSSTRGAMTCVESGTAVSCNFQEADGVTGRLDCAKSQSQLELSCAWITFLPRPATGRAAFTRATSSERRLTGTWGTFLATSGAGTWNAQPL
jgi:astacin (peptidase family M12A)